MAAKDLFGKVKSRWTEYAFELRINTLVGGIPADAKTIEGWIKSRLDLGDAALRALMDETIAQVEWRNPDEPSSEELEEAIAKVAAQSTALSTFKMVDGQLVWEGRCLKAALVEAAAVCYPNKRWPTPKPEGLHQAKGFRSWFVEQVEVKDQYFPLGRSTPDVAGEQRIGHITGKTGPQSIIKAVDAVHDAKVSGTLQVLDDAVSPQVWSELWEYVERGGVGADRSRGDGRNELLSWTRVG